MNESRPIKSKQRAELNSALCASCVQAECNLQLGEQSIQYHARRLVNDNVLYHSLSALASAEVNFWFTCRRKRLVTRSGRVWRKVPDDILSYLGVGLNLSARRLPPSLLRPCCVALSSDFVEGTFISFPESTA